MSNRLTIYEKQTFLPKWLCHKKIFTKPVSWTKNRLVPFWNEFGKRRITNVNSCHSRGSGNPGGAFTKLAFNLIVKRKSGYYDNPVKKLSFPLKRESRGRIYKACLQLDWSDKPGEAITKRVLNFISNLSFRPQGGILKIQKVVYTKFHIMLFLRIATEFIRW